MHIGPTHITSHKKIDIIHKVTLFHWGGKQLVMFIQAGFFSHTCAVYKVSDNLERNYIGMLVTSDNARICLQ